MNNFYEQTPEQQVEKLRPLALSALRDNWHMDNPGIELIKYRENAVFSVVDSQNRDRYALRIHRPGYHSVAEIRSELQWMEALNEAGVATPPIVHTASGDLLVTHSDPGVPEPRHVDLLGWIEGRQMGTIENEDDSDISEVAKNHFLAGRLAARIHNHAEGWNRPPGFTRKSWNEEGLLGEGAFLGRFGDLALLTTQQRGLLMGAKNVAISKLSAFGEAPDRYGLMHADFLPENLLMDKQDVRIIDFDDCGFGWHVMDIATSLFFLLGEPGYDEAFEGLVEGYRSERSLPDKHLEMLPTFLLTRGLTYLGWVHSRSETETAREIAPILVEGVCSLADDYMASHS